MFDIMQMLFCSKTHHSVYVHVSITQQHKFPLLTLQPTLTNTYSIKEVMNQTYNFNTCRYRVFTTYVAT